MGVRAGKVAYGYLLQLSMEVGQLRALAPRGGNRQTTQPWVCGCATRNGQRLHATPPTNSCDTVLVATAVAWGVVR